LLNPVLNLEVILQAQNSLNELTVFVSMRLVKIASRVLLDSVSFSRIMSSAQGSSLKCLARGDLMYYT